MDKSTEYTFNVEAAVTITANSEKEAREQLAKCNLEQDVDIGPGRVYLSPDALEKAELIDTYTKIIFIEPLK